MCGMSRQMRLETILGWLWFPNTCRETHRRRRSIFSKVFLCHLQSPALNNGRQGGSMKHISLPTKRHTHNVNVTLTFDFISLTFGLEKCRSHTCACLRSSPTPPPKKTNTTGFLTQNRCSHGTSTCSFVAQLQSGDSSATTTAVPPVGVLRRGPVRREKQRWERRWEQF